MKKTVLLISAVVLLTAILAGAAPAQPPSTPRPRPRTPQAAYQKWDVSVPEGTELDKLKKRYEARTLVQAMASTDLQDQSPYPLWFRRYLRDQYPGLPVSGPYQYPRVGAQILEWMLAHPDLRSAEASPSRGAERAEAARTVIVGTNINITNFNERNSESFIALDYLSPRFLIAGSNNISGSGRQKQFASSDGGATWSKTELPLAPGSSFQSDPAVAWTTDGTGWAATLGISAAGSIRVQVFKSTDRGATWSFVKTVSTGNSNDKELMWIDTHAGSSFKDNIYVAWDRPGGGMRFARSTDKGVTWSRVSTLSTDGAIGAHLTTGPSGELYVAWPDTGSREIRIRKSTNGGASFAARRVIARTNDSFEVSIPAMCRRKALIYVSLGVDRSTGPRRGWVYAVWTDRNGTATDPDCVGVASDSNSNVYFSRSTDGGATWSAPQIIHSNPPKTDQFNQWMDVDPFDGTIHVMYYDTRDDPGRKKAHVYYIASRDGGTTWVDESRVTTAPTDETVAGADTGNQYGDYNGLAAYRGVAYPVWTDRRPGVPGDKEQIFTAGISRVLITLDACVSRPWLCLPVADMRPGELTLECPVRDCYNIDPLPKNCLVKFQCPGCSPGGLCPPFYHLFLEGLDPAWEVGLLDRDGKKVAVTEVQIENGVVLSFRPSQEHFIEGQIGDYFLLFRMSDRGSPGKKYTVRTSVRVGDKPFER
jgi:hypothetical protein